MKELEEILSNIDTEVGRYNELPLFDTRVLSNILKGLTSNLYYLEKHRIKAYEDWLEMYHSIKNTSNAEKQKICDDQIRELYLTRRIMNGAYKICDAIRSQIGVYKKEN